MFHHRLLYKWTHKWHHEWSAPMPWHPCTTIRLTNLSAIFCPSPWVFLSLILTFLPNGCGSVGAFSGLSTTTAATDCFLSLRLSVTIFIIRRPPNVSPFGPRDPWTTSTALINTSGLKWLQYAFDEITYLKKIYFLKNRLVKCWTDIHPDRLFCCFSFPY